MSTEKRKRIRKKLLYIKQDWWKYHKHKGEYVGDDVEVETKIILDNGIVRIQLKEGDEISCRLLYEDYIKLYKDTIKRFHES